MIVSCPECRKKLRLSADVGSARRIKCPGCSAVFVAPAEDEEAPRHGIARGARRPTQEPRDDEDDRDEGDRDEDDRDEDRPTRRGRRPAADEDDDRPLRGKRAARARSTDEDDDEQRPRRKKRRKQTSPALLWGLIGGGVVLLGAAVLVVILLTRGGGSLYSQHEAAAREMIGLIKELAAALETVQDANTARIAAGKINSVCDRLEALDRRVRSLGKLTEEENRRLQSQVSAELSSMTQRMSQVAFQAGARSQKEPTFVAAVTRLQSMRNLGR